MFDPAKLVPILQPRFPKAKPEQLLIALTKLSKAHPNLSGIQALAALQKYMQERKSPTMGMMARKGEVM